jgi:hypothetical protein
MARARRSRARRGQGRRRAARRHYTAAYASQELGQRARPARTRPGNYSTGLDGREIPDVLAAAGIEVKTALKDAKAPEAALALGLGRAQRTAGFEIVQTGRLAQRDAMQRPEVSGGAARSPPARAARAWAAATGAIHPVGDMPKVHRHDRCVAEPVIRGVRDRVERPTGEQIWHRMTPAAQDTIFSNRGGAQKADLIRSGAVSLPDLVAPSPMASIADEITEAPLAALA